MTIQSFNLHLPGDPPQSNLLVAAERQRGWGNKAQAIELYDLAIAEAKTNGDIQAAALANELAATFYLDWGKTKIATSYIQAAYNCYAQWGAKSKTDELTRCYPQLLAPLLRQNYLGSLDLQLTNERLESIVRELQRATQLKDEFLATMSHELRTPLNAILGMSEALQEQLFGPINPRQIKSLQTIERSGRHLLSLINDILDVSKISAGKLELEINTVALHQLCHSSLAFVKQQALQKQIQVEIQLPPVTGNIAVDERRLRQVLINLLSNAVKFTPNGGQIALHAIRHDREEDGDGSGLELTVTDTGIGIASRDFDTLFQPFIQLDSSLNRQFQGTGLGLTLVKQIVELHGGSISVQSELNLGSCFTVRLPGTCLIPLDSYTLTPFDTLTDDPDLADRHLTIAPALILLVEDNTANIRTLSSYLTAKGYRTILAENGKEAIEIVGRSPPDLIVMDIQMPEMDGLEAMSWIRNDPQFAQMPIVALTALAMEGDREKCLAAGANEYLTKPVKLKQLSATIQQLLKEGISE
jgi:signal transduction histidine kinase/ActR/RegA family two-component response regulator